MEPWALLDLLFAVLKNRLRTSMGDEALYILEQAAKKHPDGAPWSLLEPLTRDTELHNRLVQATRAAESRFRASCNDPALAQWITSLPLATLPSFQAVLRDLDSQPDLTNLETIIRELVRRDWPNLSASSVQAAVELYIRCLEEALLSVDPFAHRVLGRWLLEALRDLQDIRKRITDVERLVAGTRAKSPRTPYSEARSLLASPDPVQRLAGVEALAMARDAPAIKALVSCLADEDAAVSSMAGYALAEIGTTAFGHLRSALRSRDKTIRIAAADILGDMHDVRAIGPLIENLRSRDDDVAAAASLALSQIGADAIPPLIASLESRSRALAGWAAGTLGMVGLPALSALIAYVSDPDSKPQFSVFRAFVGVGAPALQPLIEMLLHPNVEVRWIAVFSLATLQDKQAVPHLQRLVASEEDRILRAYTRECVETLSRKRGHQ